MPKEIIADARDLLEMLEALCGNLKEKNTTAEIPWAGISLTLGQCKRLLEQTLEEDGPGEEFMPSGTSSGSIYSGSITAGSITSGASTPPSPSTSFGTLSERIKPMPPLKKDSNVRKEPLTTRDAVVNSNQSEFTDGDLESKEGRFYFA